jgi:HAD superfamily hydrolase (TIGR01509 family)
MAGVIKAILFDFDGTILDTESIDLRTWTEVFEAHGVAVPLDRFALRIGTLTGPNEFDELDALLDAPCDRDAVTATRRRRELELLELEPVRPGIREYLEDAHELGLRVGVVSSSTRSWIDLNLERLGLGDVWATVVCADGDTSRCKPSPALYLEALEALGVAADEAIAVEDSPNGIAAARAAGIFCVGFPNDVTGALDLSEADLVLDSLEDVPLAELLQRVTSSRA